jgi:flagellar hook assembly protein FlgD
MGQVIRTLVDANKPAGRYSVSWDGRNDVGRLVGTGTYFLKMQSEEYQKVHKMLFVK